jgi:hypothetical protein
LALICLGLAMGSSSIFFWRYTYTTTEDCHLHVWMLNMGFSFAFGALFVRTLKIDRLWNARVTFPLAVTYPLVDIRWKATIGYTTRCHIQLRCGSSSSFADTLVNHFFPRGSNCMLERSPWILTKFR